MKNAYHKKGWPVEATQVHVHPTPTPIITYEIQMKSEKYLIKIKLCCNETSDTSDMYE